MGSKEKPGDEYVKLPPAQAAERIRRLKRQLGAELCILGHHYQRDEIFDLADFTGDSLKLSQQAAGAAAKYIVFCGVHFMAETADILTSPDRAVLLPDLSAGCPMADMADADDVAEALEALRAVAGGAKVVPVTYVNSSAAAKAITGAAGGACCTSSNARSVFEWALRPAGVDGAGADKILAIPDQHLGRNTAVAMGYTLGDCVLYDPRQQAGGLTEKQVAQARFILWKGHCHVHQRFTVEQVRHVRQQRPEIKVIVHPECPYEIVAEADLAGSTEQILQAVADSPPASSWAVGTENNMVRRLAVNNGDKYIRVLSDTPPLCATMARINLPGLLWVLDNLAEGKLVNRVSVAEDIAAPARVAVERMISIKPTPAAAGLDRPQP